MRISDWSSDVCSSDLAPLHLPPLRFHHLWIFMNVTVFGSGYVGLVTAACLADVGNHVVCVDVDQNKIATLKAGRCPFYEPGIEALLVRNAGAGRLGFTNAAPAGVPPGEINLNAGRKTPPAHWSGD